MINVAVDYLIDLLYEKKQRNEKMREVAKIILTECIAKNGKAVRELIKICQEKFGKYTGRILFYKVVNRLKKLKIVEVKYFLNLRTGKRYKVVALTLRDFADKVDSVVFYLNNHQKLKKIKI